MRHDAGDLGSVVERQWPVQRLVHSENERGEHGAPDDANDATHRAKSVLSPLPNRAVPPNDRDAAPAAVNRPLRLICLPKIHVLNSHTKPLSPQ